MKKLIPLFLTVILLFSGCKNVKTPTNTPTDNPSVPQFDYTKVTFSNMPDYNSESVQVFTAGEDNAVFCFITPGMSSFSAKVAIYSLKQDKHLGEIDLGEAEWKIISNSKGGFYAFDGRKKQITEYNEKCEAIATLDISKVSDNFSAVSLNYNQDKFLLCNAFSGQMSFFDIKTSSVKPITYSKKVYVCLGISGKDVVVLDEENTLCTVSDDGVVTPKYKNSSAGFVNDRYVVDTKGDYITFLPLNNTEPIMVKNDKMITINDASGNNALGHSSPQEGKDELCFFDLANMQKSTVTVQGTVYSATLNKVGDSITVYKNKSDRAFSYKIFGTASLEKTSLNTKHYNDDEASGIPVLPEISGSSAVKTAVSEILNKYNVRILFNDNTFDFSELGYSMSKISEQSVLNRIKNIEKVFAFLPNGTINEIGGKRPLVIYLCENLNPSAGGINTVFDGYNIIAVSAGGTDRYFEGVLAHELGHALERKTDPNVLEGWKKLMPAEAQKAYGINNLTVEFTKDDKGKTPVWFTDAYGRTNEMEDRATVFAALYADYSENTKTFTEEGLKMKADYWKTILNKTYSSCSDVTKFKW